MELLQDVTGMTCMNPDKIVESWDVTTRTQLCIQEAATQLNKVTRVIVSPDGRSLASLMRDQTVEVSHIPSGHLLCTYTGHQNPITVLAWSPKSTFIASGGSDASVQVWEVRTGKCIFTYRGHTSPVTVLAWSPDGKHIASASSDHTVQTWRVDV